MADQPPITLSGDALRAVHEWLASEDAAKLTPADRVQAILQRYFEAAELVECVAKSLFEHATWHPPSDGGGDWFSLDPGAREAWRTEAVETLRGDYKDQP